MQEQDAEESVVIETFHHVVRYNTSQCSFVFEADATPVQGATHTAPRSRQLSDSADLFLRESLQPRDGSWHLFQQQMSSIPAYSDVMCMFEMIARVLSATEQLFFSQG